MKTLLIVLSVLIGGNLGIAQEVIHLQNPSFEISDVFPYGMHPCCKAPKEWFPCGGPDLNTPDVQPGHFGVDLPSPRRQLLPVDGSQG